MTTVHLSWFDTIHDWFFNDALDYVFDWISEIWSDAFALIETGFKELVSAALDSAFGSFLEGLVELLFARFYAFLVTVLMILDCIEDCFDIVAGISPVYKNVGGKSVAMPLLNAIYSEAPIQKMISAIIGIGLVLCIFCAILATIKSMLEAEGQQTKPVGHVIRQTSKAMLYFILIPLISSFLILLSGSILNVVDSAFTGGKGKTTVARTIFTISTLDAIDTKKHPEAVMYNSSYEGDKPADFGVNDKYRSEFFLVNRGEAVPNYANPGLVKSTFTYRGIDYVIGIGMGIYFNIVLGMVLFIFICRIFDVIVLLITEPFFIAMMPLDDGEHFKSWTNLFMGKLFSGFGMVVAMRVYLMVAAMLFSNTISFVDPGSNGATIQNYLIKLIFIAGGALGIRSMGPLITGILSENAAKAEQEQAMIGAKMGGRVASFQGKRMGKLLMSSGRIAGAIGSSVLGATTYLGARTIKGTISGTQKFGGFIKRRFTGRGTDGKNGQNAMQYSGGVPQNLTAKDTNPSAASAQQLPAEIGVNNGGVPQNNTASNGNNAVTKENSQNNTASNGNNAVTKENSKNNNATVNGSNKLSEKRTATDSLRKLLLGDDKKDSGNVLDTSGKQSFNGDRKLK